MARKYGFVSYTNNYGIPVLISASKISMIYYDEDQSCFKVLYSDGSEVVLDITRSDYDNLIQRLIVVDGL